MIKGRLQLVLIMAVTVAVCSATSHVAISWLKIRVKYSGYQFYGAKGQKATTILHGSSLAYDGLDWEQISKAQGKPIETWATAGSSPAEWEVEHHRSSDIARVFIVVSAYDLNEYWLCDFRADIVPLRRTLRDLWECGAEWQFSKRLLSQYPMTITRKLFPVVGRSDGVMTGVRDKLQRIFGESSNADGRDATKFDSTSTSQFTERVTDWSAGRLQRRLALMRSRCQGRHSFNGPKKQALERLLHEAAKAEVVMIVMPVSPIYQREFLNPAADQEFERSIAEVQQGCPQARLVRLDQISALQSNNMFRDFMHLNVYGQQIATAALLNQLGYKPKSP